MELGNKKIEVPAWVALEVCNIIAIYCYSKQNQLLKNTKMTLLKYTRGHAFPKISNQKINPYLKEIATFLEIDIILTFHIARHTFITKITLSCGVIIETGSKLLGHTNIKTIADL